MYSNNSNTNMAIVEPAVLEQGPPTSVLEILDIPKVNLPKPTIPKDPLEQAPPIQNLEIVNMPKATISKDVGQQGSPVYPLPQLTPPLPSFGLVPPIPIPEEESPMPEFPIEVFPLAIRDMAKECARVNQISESVAAMCGLSTMSASIGNSMRVTKPVSGKDTYLNIYTVIGSPKGTCKSSSSQMVQPLLTRTKEVIDNFMKEEIPKLEVEAKTLGIEQKKLLKAIKMTDVLEEKQDLRVQLTTVEKRLREIKPNGQDIPLPEYIVSNITSEALVKTLSENRNNIFSYSAEAGEAIRVALGKYSQNADIDILLSGYSVEDCQTNRVSRGSTSVTPCIVILWLVQPTIISELLSSDDAFDRGLTARILMFDPKTELVEDTDELREYDPTIVGNYYTLIQDRFNARIASTETAKMECSREARIALINPTRKYMTFSVG